MQPIHFEHSTVMPPVPKTIGRNLMGNLWTLGRKRRVSDGTYLEFLDEEIGTYQSLYQLDITAGNDDNFQ